MLRGVLAAAVICCATTASAGAASAHPATCPGSGLRPSAANLAIVDSATLCLVNRVRTAHRLRPLRANAELAGVASGQAGSMVRWDYFADVRPTGQTPLALVSATRYPADAASVLVGQNIAWGTGGWATPAHVVACWLQSAAHRAIILDGGFTDAGVAAVPAVPTVVGLGLQGATYAMEFGARAPKD